MKILITCSAGFIEFHLVQIYAIGFLAQLFFSARILCQWILSERAKKNVSPSIYWILSIAGSYLLFIYGWFRDDFSIIFGQLISYSIYLWNLNEKNIWHKIHWTFKFLLIFTPIVAILFMLGSLSSFIQTFFRNEDIPLWLLIFGSIGQIIFTLRFIYQWLYSRRFHESLLPTGFWIISLIGSASIVSYGIIRSDPVLVFGQSFGFIAYIRNLIIGHRNLKQTVA